MTQKTQTKPNAYNRTLKTASFLISTIIAVIGLIISIRAQNQSSTSSAFIKASRVQIGNVSSNNICPEFNYRWEPWIEKISNKTTYLGVKRKIHFIDKFEGNPQVLSAIKLINIQPFEVVFDKFDFTSENAEEDNKLQQFHVVTFTENPDAIGFTLKVGVGLPSRAADTLINHFRTHQPLKSTIEDRFGFGNNCNHIESDNWALMFYETIGTIDMLWIAQTTQLKP